METRTNIKMSSGNVHDLKYLYVVLYELNRKGGRVKFNNFIINYLVNAINSYNENKAIRFGLSSRPRRVGDKTVVHLINELKSLNLIIQNKEDIFLSEHGNRIVTLIEAKQFDELKFEFTRLILERFTIFEFFLKKLDKLDGTNGVHIPFITAEIFDRFSKEPLKVAENYIDLISDLNNIDSIKKNKLRLYQRIENESLSSIEKRTKKIEKLQAILEKYFVNEFFSPEIKNRRTYDFVRARTTFLGLTNYANFNFNGFFVEKVYLISNFDSNKFRYSTKEIIYSNGKIYLHTPKYYEIKEQFKNELINIYLEKRDEWGYVKIADMRDLICWKLKISDSLFDTFLRELAKEEPNFIVFTYTGANDRITEKRLPLIIEKDIRELYNLMKINY